MLIPANNSKDSAINITKIASPTSGVPCTNVTFIINVTNTGDCTLDPVTVEDILPVGMIYVSSIPAGSVVGNKITWSNVGPLNAGASATIMLVTCIAHGPAGTLTDIVIVIGKPPAGDNVIDSDTEDVTRLKPDTLLPCDKELFPHIILITMFTSILMSFFN